MSSRPAPVIGALLALALLPGLAPAAAPPRTRIERLIDQLVHVRESDYDYAALVRGSGFLPLDRQGAPRFYAGMRLQSPPVTADVLRELVRQGAAAVPHLVAHLRDARSTRLVIRHPNGGKVWGTPPSPLRGPGRPFLSYTATVADLCALALGQIVNRERALVSTYEFRDAFEDWFSSRGNISVFPLAASLDQVESLSKEWGALTLPRHKASLVDDFRRAVDHHMRVGAGKRLACYYPDALEALAPQLLSLPTYNYHAAEEFFWNELYPARTTKERCRLLEAFVARYGKPAREAVLRRLFAYLPINEDAQTLLVELFGQPAGVRNEDRPVFLTALDDGEKAELIRTALVHVPGRKVGVALRDLLASPRNSDDVALACLKALAGRGFDSDVEAYLRRGGGSLPQEQVEPVRTRLGWTPLHAAVAHGQRDRVRRLLAGGARADARARNGDTPLHLAVRGGDEAVLRQLLTGKVNLDVKGSSGLTPVQEAARADRDALAVLLLKKECAVPDILVAALADRTDLVDRLAGADGTSLRAKTASGRTALFLAAAGGHAAAVRRLLARGAAGDSLKDGRTPLHEAAARGHATVTRVLIDHKAEVDAPLRESLVTPLHLAAGHGHAEVVRLLLEKGPRVDRGDGVGRTALLHAVEARRENIASLLLKHGADPRLPAKDGELPLHAAVSAGRVTLLPLLLRAGAELEARAMSTGETALHRAAREGRIHAARLLLDRGARVDARDADGNTPLHLAVSENHEGLTRLLLQRKADPEALNRFQAAPLHVAAWFGCARAAELLVAHGAKVERAMPLHQPAVHRGGTPLRLAIHQDHPALVRLLLAHRASPLARSHAGEAWDTPLHAAVQDGRVEIARILLERGVPVDIKDCLQRTPLHHAVEAPRHSEALVRLLLGRKANARAPDEDGWQPLHLAAQASNARAAALLLKSGASANAREKEEGRTPLHLAIENDWHGHEPTESRALPVVRLLLEHGADTTIQDNQGRTPLTLAKQREYAEVVRLLGKHGARK